MFPQVKFDVNIKKDEIISLALQNTDEKRKAWTLMNVVNALSSFILYPMGMYPLYKKPLELTVNTTLPADSFVSGDKPAQEQEHIKSYIKTGQVFSINGDEVVLVFTKRPDIRPGGIIHVRTGDGNSFSKIVATQIFHTKINARAIVGVGMIKKGMEWGVMR